MKPYYQDDAVTIYCGDCRDILPYLPKVDLVLTDPPYNLGKKYGTGTNDSRDLEEYWNWFGDIFSSIYRTMDDGFIYCSHSDKGAYQAKPTLETIGFEYIQTLIWWGRNGYSMQLHRQSWSYRHEPILFMRKGTSRDLEVGTDGLWYTSVIEAPRPQSNFIEGRSHPTQKPVLLYKTLLARTPSSLILDPFLGSGTSVIASKQLNKKIIGIEIEEKYCEIAAKRCQQCVMDLQTGNEKQSQSDDLRLI
jgi:DNA modification methylase